MAGELTVVSVTIDGAPIDLDDVLADVTIHHGRTGFYDDASASTAQLTLIGVTRAFTRPFRLGSLLVVNASDGATTAPRFTGRFTDSTLDVDRLTAIAVGRLRTLSGYTVGAVDYPEETWSARVTRAFTEAGLAAVLTLQPPTGAGIDPVLVARLTERVPLSDYLNELAGMIGAAIADLPNGNILVQAISSRALAAATALDPAEVAYSPEWSQRLPGGNIVTVEYGPPPTPLLTTVQDAASVALYGPIALTVQTKAKLLTDATAIGNARLARDAYSHWNADAAPLLVGRRLNIGTPLQITSLPPAAPFDPWTPILEGWTDQIVSDGKGLNWTMELSLSDPLLSGLTLPWNGVPVAETWLTINQTVAWRDALTIADVQ